MKNKKIEDFVSEITDANDLHQKLKKDMQFIVDTCSYSDNKNKKFAEQIQSCVKFFYKKSTKTSFGKITPDKDEGYLSSFEYQISKRGIGYRYYSTGNMSLIHHFTSDINGGNSKTCFALLLTNKDLFDSLKDELNEDGKIFFDDLKTTFEKYNLKDATKRFKEDIEIPKILSQFCKEKMNVMEISISSHNIEISFKAKDSPNYLFADKELFSFINDETDLETKVFQIYYKEKIEQNIQKAKEYCIPKEKEWRGFEDEFNQQIAKYIMLSTL